MAVYERRYRTHAGPLETGWRRHLVIPRYAYEEAFATRRFLLLFAGSFLPTIVALLLVFLQHNLSALVALSVPVDDLIDIGPRFFQLLLTFQSGLAFVLALVLGPTLISADLAHNALPLYLARPISRREYVAGKVLVLFLLMSAVTWAASLTVFGLEASFSGPAWIAEHAWVPLRIVIQGVGWALLVSLLAVAFSAWLKWKPIAAGGLLFVFLVPTGFAEIVNQLFGTRWGLLISPTRSAEILSDALFRRTTTTHIVGGDFGVRILEAPPPWAAALSLCLLMGAALFVLNRRLQAYEVVT